MIKNKHKVAFCVLGVAAVLVGIKMLLKNTLEPLVPTQDISHTQPIGGTPSPNSSPVQTTTPQKSSASHAVPTVTKSTLAARDTPQSAPNPTPNSPPQQAVTEFKYTALGGTPNDSYYPSQWHLQSVSAVNAWSITNGAPVIVAVIDTGYALGHEDLASSWYINPGESGDTLATDRCWSGAPQNKTTNNCDDDNNGYVDDWRGWNFYGRYQATATPCAPDGLGTYVENNNPQAGQSGDDIFYQEYITCTGSSIGNPYAAVSHGTSTAGLAGAATNNSIGIASLNWNTKIMPLQALGDDGSGWTSDITRAIRYAVDNGAQIINMSLGGPDVDPTLQSAIDYAYQNNVVIVAAAGNCGTGSEAGCDVNKPGQMMYPAIYPHVLSVGATNQSDTRASFSSYGRGLDVVAPGYGSIISPLVDTRTQPYNYTNAYSGSLAGTSFSSPIVASVASLIRSVRPNTSIDDISALLIASARKPSSMNGAIYTSQYGHGIIDAGSAAVIAQALQSQSTTPTYNQTGNYQSEHTYRAADTLSSGCTISANSYCAIRWTEKATGYERYLPYKQANLAGQTGWQWSGTTLEYGEWWGVAQSGDNFSTTDYLLFAK